MVLSKRASQKQGEESRCWSKLKHTWARIIIAVGLQANFGVRRVGKCTLLESDCSEADTRSLGRMNAQGIATEKKTFLMLVIFLMRQ